MAAPSHFHLRPTAVSHNQNALSNRVTDFVPVRTATGFRRSTGPGAPPFRSGNLTRRPGLSFTTLAGFGSTEGASFQALAAIDGVEVLRAWWIAMALPILAAPKIRPLHQLLLSLSGRGKILESSSERLSVPQKFFSHFYVVGVLWNTILLLATWMYAIGTAPAVPHQIWNTAFLLLLMEAQVLRRLFETAYVFKYSPSARMHIAAYVTGILFYITAPLSLCCANISEVLKFAGSWFMAEGMALPVIEFSVNPFMQLNWYVWIGAAVFFYGWIHQRRCHAILGSLRKSNEKINRYAIPRGDWFEYVSSPHYLAEIVMYFGLVIASGSDITVWSLFGFVMVNLTFTAAVTHKWYLRKFHDYPKNRFAIIPFLC